VSVAERLAALPRRLGALVYEALLLLAFALVAGFALLPLVSPHASTAPLMVPALLPRAISFCALVGGAAVYCTWFWSDGRRTLPQKTWRIRLVDADGRPPTKRTALLRYAAGWIGPGAALGAYAAMDSTRHAAWSAALLALGYGWALIDREHQFLHDRIAGTRLVLDRNASGLVP
jgi:uncharacterized RDD family membrane protein YckC